MPASTRYRYSPLRICTDLVTEDRRADVWFCRRKAPSFHSCPSSCFIPYIFLCSVRFDFPRKRILSQGGAERSGFSVLVLKRSVNGCRKTRGCVGLQLLAASNTVLGASIILTGGPSYHQERWYTILHNSPRRIVSALDVEHL